LPVTPTDTETAYLALLTGQAANTGTNPATECAACPTVGALTRCMSAVPLGRICLDARVLEVPLIGTRANRSVFRDFQLLGGQPVDNAPSLPNSRDVLNAEVGERMLELSMGWATTFGGLTYTGNPANNANAYREMKGFDLLINTPYADAETSAACPAADPIIVNHNADVTDSAFVGRIVNIYRALKERARRTRLAPATWAITMRRSLFVEVANVWPCAYNTYRCTVQGLSNQGTVDAAAMRKMTDDMLTGDYLLIDGEKVSVITDPNITEADGVDGEAGLKITSIYFVPLRILGATPATYVEYFNFNNPFNAEVRGLAPDRFATLDNGRYLLIRDWTKGCITMSVVERSRLVLGAPFLSARVTNVKYAPAVPAMP